ncbi:LIM domain only protein 7-like [Embiotoca jacksoni]|uniref:LIM domain only protein 7-like n=1 Tax=Embiotoca jacksoni TaxID=100190 RepID=UPI0037040662
MEWRQQTSIRCADAFDEAQRWIEEVTGKLFGCNNFRAALENGVLLCDLINKLKSGIIKKVNRLSTPIAGLDNVNVFLKACGKLGLNDSQLFHPGDLQDLSTRVTLGHDESNRRLKNVLITIYWLGRKAHLDAVYSGPQLNLKAFEGLLGSALPKSLDEGSNVHVKDGGYRECRSPERWECRRMRLGYKREDSVDSIESLGSRALCPNGEGCGSDAEAEQVFRMENTQPSAHQNKGHIPPPLLWKKRGRQESLLHRAYQIQVRPERPVQVNPGWIWSKSHSDIPMVYPARKVPDGNTISGEGQDTGEENLENGGEASVGVKESEAMWQDDLTKWKNRRRSTNSDQRRKSQDREHVISQMTNGGVTNLEKNEAQGGLTKRDQHSLWKRYPAHRPYSTSPPSKSSSSDLQPCTRALLALNSATKALFSPTAALLSSNTSAHTQGSSDVAMPASDGNDLGEKPHFASLASDGAKMTTPFMDCSFSPQTQEKARGSSAPSPSTSEQTKPEHVFTNQISTLVTTIKPKETTKSANNMDSTSSMSSHEKLPSCVDPKVSQRETQKSPWEPAVDQGRAQPAAGVYKYLSRAGTWSGSASLPRGYRQSEGSSRLSSAITARPFGTKQSTVSSLQRMCDVDDNRGRLLNSKKADSLASPSKSSLRRQSVTGCLRGQDQVSFTQRRANTLRQNGTEQEEVVNSVGLSKQTSFQFNGYPHQLSFQMQILAQPYSNLQSHHDESFPLSSSATTNLPKAAHSDMRVSLTLKPNSVPDFGFHTHWDTTGARITFIQPGSPAELCRLCVDDEIVAVDAVAVTHMSYSQWKDKMASALQTGNLNMDICRHGNKDWSTSEGSLHSQPGQSRMTHDLTAAAPALIGCSDHHANSVASKETAVAKVSQLNGQTDDGKVMGGELSDNPRTARSKDFNIITRTNLNRRAAFFKQKGGSESAISDLQVPSLSPSSSSWSWDREGDRRRQEKWQEEQERLLQEQYQRDQERLEAEWQRSQQDAIEVRKSRQNAFEMTADGESAASTQPHVNGLTKKTSEEEQSPEGRELTGVEAQPESNVQGVQNDTITEKDWADGSCGFAQLSPAHRAKSLSTPVLASPHRPTRGDQKQKTGQSVSKAEQDRQQILQEMKKRTLLLTDNSWIRQHTPSFHKEPIMKMYDSLDDLDALRQSSVSTAAFSYPHPHSAAAGYCTPSRNSYSRYSTGSILSHKYTSMDASHHGTLVSGRRTCCVCERVLGSGAAMVMEALSLRFHLACFQCVGCCRHLGGTQTGVQVRIRNRKPYCEPCYLQLESTGTTPHVTTMLYSRSKTNQTDDHC